MKKLASPLIILWLAGCSTTAAPTSQAARAPAFHLAGLGPTVAAAARKTLNTEIPQPFEDEAFLWTFANGVIVAGAASLGAALHASQDPKTGQVEGTLFAQSSTLNRSFLGRITGGKIDYASHTAHLTGQLVEGTPFSVDVAGKDGPNDPDQVSVKIPGAVAITGKVHSGDVRVVKALPLGIDFRGTPGYVYDYHMGLFIPEADKADGISAPLDVPDNQFVCVSFDPTELPNGTFPGDFNAVPGIGNDVPVFHDDLPFFPFGVPTFDVDHPLLLGVDPFGA